MEYENRDTVQNPGDYGKELVVWTKDAEGYTDVGNAVMIPRAKFGMGGGSRGKPIENSHIKRVLLTKSPEGPFIDLDTQLITPQLSAKASRWAAAKTSDPAEAAVLAYRYMAKVLSKQSDGSTKTAKTARKSKSKPKAHKEDTMPPEPRRRKVKRKVTRRRRPKPAPQEEYKEEDMEDVSVLEEIRGMQEEQTLFLGKIADSFTRVVEGVNGKTAKVENPPERDAVIEAELHELHDVEVGEPAQEFTTMGPKFDPETDKQPPAHPPIQAMQPGDLRRIANKSLRVIGIPNLEIEAKDPEFQVRFTLPGGGKINSFYHWVGFSDDGESVFCIWDNRYRKGTQFSPPATGEEEVITVDFPQQGQTLQAHSLGYEHDFGIFHFVTLFIKKGTLQDVDKVSDEMPVTGGFSLDTLLDGE